MDEEEEEEEEGKKDESSCSSEEEEEEDSESENETGKSSVRLLAEFLSPKQFLELPKLRKMNL